MNIRVLTERNVTDIARELDVETPMFYHKNANVILDAYDYLELKLDLMMQDAYPAYVVIDVDSVKRKMERQIKEINYTRG